MPPIYREPVSPHFTSRRHPAIKPPCTSHASAWFRILATAGAGVESRKLPARLLHARTQQSHRAITHLPSQSEHAGMMGTDMPRAWKCHDSSSYHSGGLLFPDKLPTPQGSSCTLTHESCPHTSTDTEQTEETYDAQSPVLGTLRATCFLQRWTGPRRARCANATPGTPHRRTPLPKVGSALVWIKVVMPRILLGER